MVDMMSPYSRQCVMPILRYTRPEDNDSSAQVCVSQGVWRAIGERNVVQMLAGIRSCSASVVSS